MVKNAVVYDALTLTHACKHHHGGRVHCVKTASTTTMKGVRHLNGGVFLPNIL